MVGIAIPVDSSLTDTFSRYFAGWDLLLSYFAIIKLKPLASRCHYPLFLLIATSSLDAFLNALDVTGALMSHPLGFELLPPVESVHFSLFASLAAPTVSSIWRRISCRMM